MARICIITSGQLGSNPRTVKEATALVAAGHDVTVIATRVLDEVEARDQAVLAEARWRTIRLSFATRRDRIVDRVIQSAANWAFRRTGSRHFAAPMHSEMTRRLSRAARRVPADLYIAHYVAALPAAAAAARANRAIFAFDAEDFHPGDLPDDDLHRPARQAVMAIERRLLPRAAYVTAASAGIAQAYADTYRIARPSVVLNVFPLRNAPPFQRPPAEDDPKSIYWFSQTIGPDRGLESAIRALALTRNAWSLQLRGMISPAYEAKLRTLAAEHDVADRLILLPPAAPDEMERLAAPHTLGLAAEVGHTQNRQIALTNKQFTYLLAGLPVLMSDIPAHTAFAQEAEGAVFLFRTDDAQSLADRIDELLDDPALLAGARTKAYHLGQERFNWDAEQHRFLNVVNDALAAGVDDRA